MPKLEYRTCCISSTYEAIHAMIDAARPITFATFFKHVDYEEVRRSFGYDRSRRQGLTLRNDWHVAYFKSTYLGEPCYFLTHSAIEYIWT